MGRRNRERIARIEAGEEESTASKVRKGLVDNPLSRKVIAISSRKGIVEELSRGSTVDQVGKLNTLVGTRNLSKGKLKEAIMKKAPKEMDKAIKTFRKQGKEVTVNSLCAEIKSDSSFQNMCTGVGLEVSWFENLARERMEAKGL